MCVNGTAAVIPPVLCPSGTFSPAGTGKCSLCPSGISHFYFYYLFQLYFILLFDLTIKIHNPVINGTIFMNE